MHFNSFARLHVPDLVSFFVDAFPSPLHDVPPPGVSNATGSPLGGTPELADTADGSAAGLNSNMNSFSVVGSIVPSVPSLHVAQPPGPDTGIGSPPGDPPAPVVSPDGGAAASNSNMNSNIFLALAPQLICRLCGVTFRPQIGVECDSLCDDCRAPCLLLPPPKRLRIVGKTNPHRKAGPPL